MRLRALFSHWGRVFVPGDVGLMADFVLVAIWLGVLTEISFVLSG